MDPLDTAEDRQIPPRMLRCGRLVGHDTDGAHTCILLPDHVGLCVYIDRCGELRRARPRLADAVTMALVTGSSRGRERSALSMFAAGALVMTVTVGLSVLAGVLIGVFGG